MRSLLFVPGDSERKLEKGFPSGADVVIVDLEDSVAPANKAAARDDCRRLHQAGDRRPDAPKIYVRVNDLVDRSHRRRPRGGGRARPDGIMLPKCNAGADVARSLRRCCASTRPKTASPTARSRSSR